MVVLSECYLQKPECKAIMEAFKTFRRFVDDSHTRFEERPLADKFLEILNIKIQQQNIQLNLKITNR